MNGDRSSRRDRMWDHVGRGELNAAAREAILLLEGEGAPAEHAEANAALGQVLQRVGRIAESRDRFSRAAALVASDPREQASYLADAASSRFLLGDLEGARRDAERARALGDRYGNRFATCEAMNMLAAVAMSRGRPAEALRLTRPGVSLRASATAMRRGGSMTHLHHGLALVELDRFAEAEEAFTEGLRRAVGTRSDSQLPWYHAMRGLGRFLGGRWDEAVADAQASVEAAGRTGTRIALPFGRAVIALVEANRANQSAARVLMAASEDDLTAVGLPGGDWTALARSACVPSREAAYAALLEGWLHVRRTPYLLSWRLLGPYVVRHALDCGDTVTAARVAAACRLGSELAGNVASARAVAHHCNALVDGDAEEARACVAEYRRSGRPFSLGVGCLHMSVVLHEAGDTSAARLVAREAVEVFSVLRATPWLARAGRLMQELGPAPQAAVPAGWSTLTPAEQQVARLVARGLTNPEIGAQLFVSPRTVQAHTSRIYAKLGISSRVQLAALLPSGRT